MHFFYMANVTWLGFGWVKLQTYRHMLNQSSFLIDVWLVQGKKNVFTEYQQIFELVPVPSWSTEISFLCMLHLWVGALLNVLTSISNFSGYMHVELIILRPPWLKSDFLVTKGLEAICLPGAIWTVYKSGSMYLHIDEKF